MLKLVKDQKEMLSAQNKEINSKSAQKEKITSQESELVLEMKQLDHKLSKVENEAKDSEKRVCYVMYTYFFYHPVFIIYIY